MEANRAKDILRSLADGRDPATGEQFPPNSPYQQADAVRALFMAVDALDNASRRARRQAARAERAAGDPDMPGRSPEVRRPIDPNRPKLGTAWTPEEEAQLREEFAAHKPLPDIAAAHGRNVGGITARLVKLGLIDAPATSRTGQPPRPIRPDRPASYDSPASRPAPQVPREITEKEKEEFPF